MKKKAKRNPYKKPEVREAIIASLLEGATVQAACKGSKVSRQTYYYWYNTDPDFKNKVDEAKLQLVEVVEDYLLTSAKRGSVAAQIFMLCNRAPERWKNVQKVEASLHAESPISFVLFDPAKHAKPGKSPKPA